MTRRIAAAILLTVWATLVVGGVVAYFTTRSVLLADLDNSLVARASALPGVGGGRGPAPHEGDRFAVRDEVGRTIDRWSETRARPGAQPEIVHATIATLAGDGSRVRTLTIRFPAAGAEGAAGGAATEDVNADPPDFQAEEAQRGEQSEAAVDGGQAGAGVRRTNEITVVYSGSAEGFYRVLNRLGVALGLCALACGAAAAGVAVVASRAALRPLVRTADAIGSIDELSLDRRIDASALPKELAPVAARLNEMLARIEQAFEQRKQFLAGASHELRTPVAALVTTLEVALRGRRRDPAELEEALRDCLNDARMLRRLVTALLEQARGESPAGAHEPERFDLAELLDECAGVACALARGGGEATGGCDEGITKGITVVRSYPSPMPVRTQPERLRSVVMNLLSNAVEYNRPGGTVELSAKFGVEGAVEIAVRDTGPGIAAEHLPNLFQPFYRADAVRGSAGQHMGLGLFLVQSHVKAMGGQCRVQSRVGEGTTMYVTVPNAVEGDCSAAPALASPAAESSPAPTTPGAATAAAAAEVCYT